MEYILGAAFAVASMYFVNRVIISKAENVRATKKVHQRQSRTFEMVKPAMVILQYFIGKEKPLRQSQKFEDSLYIRIVFFENKAYWIRENVFYVADLVDGEVDKESTRKVDTIAMDKVQLDKMVFIVEQLTEGKIDDNSNPG